MILVAECRLPPLIGGVENGLPFFCRFLCLFDLFHFASVAC